MCAVRATLHAPYGGGMRKTKTDLLLSLAEQAELRRFVEEAGEKTAIGELKIDRSTLARALGGLPVRRSTLTVLRLTLTRHAAERDTR